jgi:hypothetical protein
LAIPNDVLFDQTQKTLIEEGLPQHRGAIGVNNTYFGEVSGQGFTGVKQTWSGKFSF